MKSILILSFLIVFVCSPAAFSQSRSTTVAGVSFENTVQVGGETLVLNGAGVRTKSFFKVYAAGLYITESKKATADVLALRGPKRIAITILRDISAEDAGQSFNAALVANLSREERARMVTSIAELNELLGTTPVLKKGDVITLDLVPGSGLRCSLNGKTIGETIGNADFYKAVLRVWLGDRSVDRVLKTALLQGIGPGNVEPTILRRPGRPITDNNN